MARFRFFAAAATTGLKGREKMIVVNPQTVTNRELAALAMQAKGRISRLYLHWTAGHYEDVYDDYHLNIGPGGEMYLTCKTFTEVKEHTWHRNTGSIGIALCCASEAQACSGRDTDFGGERDSSADRNTGQSRCGIDGLSGVGDQCPDSDDSLRSGLV